MAVRKLRQCFITCYAIIVVFLVLGVATTHASHNPHQRNPTSPSYSSCSSLQEEVQQESGYRIISDNTIFSRWRSIISRVVKMPNGNVVDYDIVDQKGAGAVIIFAWDSKKKTATVIKEYNPGCHKILHGLAAGIVETDVEKHGADFDIAAKQELEEECHLAGGTWYRLTDEGISVPMDKYAVTELVAYLVIDPIKVSNPRPLDAEEDIEIIDGVGIEQIMSLIRGGQMNLVGGWGSLLAIMKLKELNEV